MLTLKPIFASLEKSKFKNGSLFQLLMDERVNLCNINNSNNLLYNSRFLPTVTSA